MRRASARRGRAFAGAFLGLAAALAFAHYTVRAQEYGGFRSGAPGAFDFYVLALSWSPTWCGGEGGSRERDGQCRPGRGLGFVVHGLWPQYARGYPNKCASAERALTPAAVEAAGAIMPSLGLARHEWRAHGTCSGLDPTRYFQAVRQAREAVTIPEAYRKPAEDLRASPPKIARAFVEANPGLRTDMIAVTCRHGQLHEVRICFTKDLRAFTACPSVARQGCRGGGEVAIEAAR